MTETNPTPPALDAAFSDAWRKIHGGLSITVATPAERALHRAGYEAASARPAVEGGWVVVPGSWRGDVASYALHYGGRCRDCADEDGVCPASGLPCEVPAARKAVEHVLTAVTYGVQQGYLAAAPPPPVGDHKALIEALAPFADFGEFLAQETEGLHDLDQIELRFEESDVLLGRLSVGAFRLAAALSQRASGADEGWRDIASAPRDGTRVLVLTSSDQLPVEVMSYDGPSDGAIYSGARSVYNWANDAGVHAHDGALLGWIPLPPPPSGADEGAGG